MKRSKVISNSLAEWPLNSTRASRSLEDSRYASSLAFCSAAVGGGGTLESAKLAGAGSAAASDVAMAGGGAPPGRSGSDCFSSETSERRSPSEVNSRRSVTVKPVSCFFSAIVYFLLRSQQVAEGQL